MDVVELGIKFWAVMQIYGAAVGIMGLIGAIVIYIKGRKDVKEMYDKHPNNVCPKCGSDEIEWFDDDSVNDEKYFLWECNECDFRWVTVYKYSHSYCNTKNDDKYKYEETLD